MTHPELVRNLCKPGVDICLYMTGQQAHCLHMAIGCCGEAGELSDAIKKWAIYCQPLDRENVIEELGDLFFFIEGLMQSLQLTREEVIQANIDKLTKRYPNNTYSDKAAKERKDKTPK